CRFCGRDLHRGQAAEKAVVLVVEARRKEDAIRWVARSARKSEQAPKPLAIGACNAPVELNRLSARVRELTQERPRARIEDAHAAIAEVADQDVVAELPEFGWRLSYAPGRIKLALGARPSEAPQERPRRRVHIDKSVSGSSHIVVLIGVL